MTATAGALPRLPRWLSEFLRKPGNWLPAMVWLDLVLFGAFKAYEEPWVSTFGLLLINSVAMVLFVTRRDASRVGSIWEGLIAVSGTFVVTLLLVVSNDEGTTLGPDAPYLATLIQCAGIAGWAVSLLALGRSLGIAPADRGIVRHGPYGLIRHPIYAFEALFFIGWLINVHTVSAALIIAVWCALQVTRIVLEERIIAGYGEYRGTVRWRIIPGVW